MVQKLKKNVELNIVVTSEFEEDLKRMDQMERSWQCFFAFLVGDAFNGNL